MAVLAFLTFEALTTERFSWDLAVTEWVQSVDAEMLLGPIPDHINKMGVLGLSGVMGAAVIAWLWFKGWRTEAVFVALVGIADLLNPLLRDLIGRPRPTPNLIIVDTVPHGFSFPSGTSMHVIMFGGIIIYLSRYVLEPSRLRTTLWVLLSLYIPIMGLWLVYCGLHWPSDVLGGYVYGAFFLWVLVWGYHKYTTWRRAYPKECLPRERLPTVVRPLAWIVRMIH